MSSSNYKYFTDLNVLYQVTLPDDFAAALGQTPAGGSEPYLAQEIRPRTVNYRSLANTVRSVVFTTHSSIAFPPPTISVGGTIFYQAGRFGETIGAYLSPSTLLGSGPPGSPGTNGNSADIVTVTGTLTAAMIRQLSVSPQSLYGAPGPGKWRQYLLGAYKYNYNGTPYTGAFNLTVAIPGYGGTTTMFNSTQMNGTSVFWSSFTGQAVGQQSSGVENTGLLASAGGAYVGSGGTITYSIDYRDVTL